MKKWNWKKWALLGLGILILFGAFYLGRHLQKRKEVKQADNRPPDTLIKTVYIPDTFWKEKEVVKPRFVTLYRDKLVPVNDMSLKRINDSLYAFIRGHKTDSVRVEYITEYLRDLKLISGKFTKDSLQLDYLALDGSVTREQYTTDYTRYGYLYRPGSIQRYSLKANKAERPKKSFLEASVFGGYDYYHKTVHIMPEGTLKVVGPLSIAVRVDLQLLNENQVRPLIGLKYQIR